jgi:transcriptional regulator with XRE-family HTH domain
MVIAERLRALREKKNMSQGEIEERTGLLRCYISRIENGHTVPSIDTLEKITRALEVPIYQLFYDGEKPPAPKILDNHGKGWGYSRREARVLDRFRRLLNRASEADRKLLLLVAQKMSQKRKRIPRR